MIKSQTMQRVMFEILARSGGPALLRRMNRTGAAILMYHSIVEQPPIAWTQVHVDSFRRQMKYLARTTTVLPMSELWTLLKTGDIPPRATAVTFDDGFANFASFALPVLEEFAIPATVYLTTSFIDGRNAFDGLIWPDYVRSLLLSTEMHSLDLTEESLPRYELASDSARNEASSHLCSAIKRWPTQRRTKLVHMLPDRLNTTILPCYRKMFAGMTWSQVKSIDKNPLVEFAAHTVSHVILSRSPDSEKRYEILESKRIIEDTLGHPISLFAYPNGGRDDYDESVLNIVRAAFDSAVTTISGLATSADDRFELPRLGIGSDMFFSKFKLFISGITKWQQG